MKDLTCSDITDILNQFEIKYSSLTSKGDVDLGLNLIRINPLYNQDVETLSHEFTHVWYEKCLGVHTMTEDEIEFESQELIKDKQMYECLDKYLYNRMKDRGYLL